MANYCTAAELRTQIEKTGTTGSGTDAALGVIIEAVSRSIDNYTNRPDGFVAVTAAARYYTGLGHSYLLIDDCTTVTEVAVKDSYTDTTYTTWAATDWQAASGGPDRYNWNRTPYTMVVVLPTGDYSVFLDGMGNGRDLFTGLRTGENYGRAVPTVKVTATWGYSAAAPAQIKQATIALSARWFKQGQGAWSDTLASPELAQLIYRKENVDIQMMLKRFVRPAIG